MLLTSCAFLQLAAVGPEGYIPSDACAQLSRRLYATLLNDQLQFVYVMCCCKHANMSLNTCASVCVVLFILNTYLHIDN